MLRLIVAQNLAPLKQKSSRLVQTPLHFFQSKATNIKPG